MTRVVVVGGGQAGLSLVAKLRSLGFNGSIKLFGEEPVAPYQRPPLSKKYLLGETTFDRLLLRPEKFFSENDIDVHLDCQVHSIDPDSKTIVTTDGNFGYDDLVLTTGSAALHLPASFCGALSGTFTVRNVADVDAMAAEFVEGARVLVIGGGYIGLEAAAVAATRGLCVTLVEKEDRILKRVAAPETSDFFRDLHCQHGVDVREGVGLVQLAGERKVTNAKLSDGTDLPVDFVVVGIGITPRTNLARDAGLAVDNGIKVDTSGRTSQPHIWAAGDCASFPFGVKWIRLESVPHAIAHAECVAANIYGNPTEYKAKPWFWSDQYDVKLQIAGLNTGYDRVVQRHSEGRSVSHWYYRGNELLAVDAMNAPREYMVGKRLIESGIHPSIEDVANLRIEIKTLLNA